MKRFSIVLISLLFISICFVFAEPYSTPIKDDFLSENLWFDSLNVRFVGNWPFGGSQAVAHDSVRSLGFCGSGGGVYILDVSSPSAPLKLSEGIHTRGIVYSLFYEAPLKRLYIADGIAGLEIWDVTDPSSPEKLGNCDTPAGDARDIYVSGSYAYVADGYGGELRVIDVSTPSDPQEVGYCYTPGDAFGVYVSGSYAYVADFGEGLRVVDVSIPSNPVEVGYCYWDLTRIFDVYVSGSYAYAAVKVFMGAGGLRVIDVSIPSNPQEVGRYDTPGSIMAENVYVSGSYAYVGAGGLRVIDVSTPTNPQQVGHYDSHGVGDIDVTGSFAYVSSGGLRVIDVSTPSNPQEVGHYGTPDWSRGAVYVSGPYAYVGAGGLRVIDISTPSNPLEVGYCYTPGGASYIFVFGSYAYVADDTAGLRVIDITTPSNPEEVGHCDTPGWANGVFLYNSYAYVADGSEGLRVIDVSSPSDPQEIGHHNTPGHAYDVFVSGSYAYVADGSDGGLRVIDVSTPSNPQEVGHCVTYSGPHGVFVSPPYAYVAEWYGLSVIDISTPSNPQEVGYIFGSAVCDVYVSTSYAYITDDMNGLRVIDISTPSNPQEVGYYNTPSIPGCVYLSGPYTYVADVGLQIYECLLEGAKNPQSEINPSSFQVSLQTDQTINQNLIISNYGDALLTWSISESPEVDWLMEDITSGWLNPGDSASASITFDATGLNLGNYYDTLVVSSNDPNNPTINVPLQLTVYTGDKIFVYPSPGFPRRGSKVLTFANLPDEGKIYVYTLSGSLVWNHSFTNIDKYYFWNGKNQFGNDIASGVYFYHVENKSGDVLEKGKFAVVR